MSEFGERWAHLTDDQLVAGAEAVVEALIAAIPSAFEEVRHEDPEVEAFALDFINHPEIPAVIREGLIG